MRKHNWEKIYSRTKQQVEKESQYVIDHIFVEKQIEKMEETEMEKFKLIAELCGVRIPTMVPGILISKTDKIQKRDDKDSPFIVNSIFTQAGIPQASAASSRDLDKKPKPGASITTSGVYFLSNELS